MSATKRSVSMDEELYAHVMKRTRELNYHDKGSQFIQDLIRKDMAETAARKLKPRNNPQSPNAARSIEPDESPHSQREPIRKRN